MSSATKAGKELNYIAGFAKGIIELQSEIEKLGGLDKALEARQKQLHEVEAKVLLAETKLAQAVASETRQKAALSEREKHIVDNANMQSAKIISGAENEARETAAMANKVLEEAKETRDRAYADGSKDFDLKVQKLSSDLEQKEKDLRDLAIKVAEVTKNLASEEDALSKTQKAVATAASQKLLLENEIDRLKARFS